MLSLKVTFRELVGGLPQFELSTDKASTRVTYDEGRELRGAGYPTWQGFLHDYRQGHTTAGDHLVFGEDLFDWMFPEAGADGPDGLDGRLRASFLDALANASPLPVHFVFDRNTEALQGLPLELLNFRGTLFRGMPRAIAVRTYRDAAGNLVGQRFDLRARPKLLLAMACPAGQERFEARTIARTLFRRLKHGIRTTVLRRASQSNIQAKLEAAERRGDPFDLFVVVAHGTRDSQLLLHRPWRRRADPVGADAFARLVVNAGPSLRLVTLCSCYTAQASELSIAHGQRLLGQAILSNRPLSNVIAFQARAPLAPTFLPNYFSELLRTREPRLALAAARHEQDRFWSVPVLMSTSPHATIARPVFKRPIVEPMPAQGLLRAAAIPSILSGAVAAVGVAAAMRAPASPTDYGVDRRAAATSPSIPGVDELTLTIVDRDLPEVRAMTERQMRGLAQLSDFDDHALAAIVRVALGIVESDDLAAQVIRVRDAARSLRAQTTLVEAALGRLVGELGSVHAALDQVQRDTARVTDAIGSLREVRLGASIGVPPARQRAPLGDEAVLRLGRELLRRFGR